jgi:dihydroxy-acid dehydratase
MTAQAMENAIRVDMAIGGSTNAIIHLKAIAGRLNLDFPLEKFDAIARTTPVLANISPSGKYLMEDFFYAGGLPALMKEILDLLNGGALTATGKTMAENLADAECCNPEVILPRDKPLQPTGGTVILRGNICPNGAVLKTSAADPKLLQHTGRAVVFENHADLLARVDSPDLDIDENCVMVLKNGGPHGGPGMPEVGNLPVPAKLLQRGITDILRISDARMSGTSYGACVLHVSPESAIGGPLAAVQTGDQIRLDVENRKLDLLIDEHEMNRRLRLFKLPEAAYERGWGKIFLDNVLQADEGCDFAVLKGKGSKTEPALPF